MHDKEKASSVSLNKKSTEKCEEITLVVLIWQINGIPLIGNTMR